MCGLYILVGIVLDGCASWEEFADETVLVFVTSAFRACVWVAIVEGGSGGVLSSTGFFEYLGSGEFRSVIYGYGFENLLKTFLVLLFEVVEDLGCGKYGFIFGTENDFISRLSFGEDYESFASSLCAYDGIHFPMTEVFSCGYFFGSGVYASSVRRFFLGLGGFVFAFAFSFEKKVLCCDARKEALRDITIECCCAYLRFYFGFVLGAK